MNNGSSNEPKADLGAFRFAFAVITDVHINPDEDVCNSPFAVNRLANRRFRHVVAMLNELDLAFVLNLGDLVHPVPAVPDLYARAARQYKEIAEGLRHPIHHLPGNHDVGDKPLAWSPAEPVSEAGLRIWQEHFGAHFHAFDEGDCRFVCLDAQILNSGLDAEERQREWLEKELADAGGRRLFVGVHYPPFLYSPDEPEHYDNIAEPARSWLLEMLGEAGIEAVFSGHVHNFWYNRHRGTDFYVLPATSFVRQDYSELFRIPPGPETEAGRNDPGKLGFVVVNVYERGHTVRPVRSWGTEAAPEEVSRLEAAQMVSPHPREAAPWIPGLDMRQPWLETIEIPPSGGLDEFDRKQVRNDYPLMTLWEMGVHRLRVPMSDFTDDQSRSRLIDLRRQGHEFTLFHYGVPDDSLIENLTVSDRLISDLELIVSTEDYEAAGEVFRALKQTDGTRLWLSRLQASHHDPASSKPYYHVIHHRFDPADAGAIGEVMEIRTLAECLDGFVFPVHPDQSVIESAAAISEILRPYGKAAALHVTVANANRRWNAMMKTGPPQG